MNILIIEDEKLAAERLRELLHAIDPSHQTTGPLRSIRESITFLQQHEPPDVILADIELSDGQCFEIFKTVPVSCPVIFTTSYNEYALTAFQTNSIDYLLKPIRQVDLEKSLNKLQAMKQQFIHSFLQNGAPGLDESIKSNLAGSRFRKSFLVRNGQRFIPVAAEEIAYFFAEGRLSYLVTWNRSKLVVDHTLEEIESMVNAQEFFRANRAFILHRRGVKQAVTLSSRKLLVRLQPEAGREVLVSKEKATEFKQWLGR
jgi:DNA-binding LytR/AlgR family response regulator